nr:PREDICTED: uncharacterized protein LOC104952888 [Notothenia coriiceps]
MGDRGERGFRGEKGDRGDRGDKTVEETLVRLVNGSGLHEGRVEVFHERRWGTICDDVWDQKDGDVVCRMLGYRGAAEIHKTGRFGQGMRGIHTRTHPLDRTVYGPLKRHINSRCDNWMKTHPGTTMTIYDLPGIVKSALPLAATPSNIQAGHRPPTTRTFYQCSSNINCGILSSTHSLLSSTRSLLSSTHGLLSSTRSLLPCQAMCGAWDITLCNAFLTLVHPSTSKSWTKEADHKGEKKKRNITDRPPPEPSTSAAPTSTVASSPPLTASSPLLAASSPVRPCVEPGTSSSATPFSPLSIRPHLKAGPRKQTTKGRKRRETAVLTDTPMKDQLEAEKKRSNAKKSKAKTKINFGQNTKLNKKQKMQASSDEDEAQYSIVCLESYSRSKEIWLQCCSCKAWAHKDCTDGSAFYTCHNCESD